MYTVLMVFKDDFKVNCCGYYFKTKKVEKEDDAIELLKQASLKHDFYSGEVTDYSTGQYIFELSKRNKRK